jgi:hypothetical protein
MYMKTEEDATKEKKYRTDSVHIETKWTNLINDDKEQANVQRR